MDLSKLKLFFTVHEKSLDMFLKPMYIVVDRDGDFVDACSGRMPPHTLNSVMERTANNYPENAPFRLLKWTGKEFVEINSLM